MADRRRVRVRATGQVQGVFFRQSVQEEADRLQLSGWVRNTPDGAVEAELQGQPDRVDEAVRFFEHGPDQASVNEVSVDDLDVDENESGFQQR